MTTCVDCSLAAPQTHTQPTYTIPSRILCAAGAPVRLPVQDVFKGRTGGTCVGGKLEAGALRPGSKVLVVPGYVAATVKCLEVNSQVCVRGVEGEQRGVWDTCTCRDVRGDVRWAYDQGQHCLHTNTHTHSKGYACMLWSVMQGKGGVASRHALFPQHAAADAAGGSAC